MLKDYANEAINIDRVIKMLLIHDIGEIDAGDTIIYSSETAELKSAEAAGVARLFAMLPEGMSAEFLALWNEFEAGETPDARYAKAIDCVPPLLHNLHGNGHSWRAHDISQEKILGLNARIGLGSTELWHVIRKQLEEAFEQGILNKAL